MKHCSSCRTLIEDGSTKCPKCQSHQNWRRFTGDLNLFNGITILATVLAIVTGFSQLQGLSKNVEGIKKENVQLVKKNNSNKEKLKQLNKSLESVRSDLQTRKVEATQLSNVVKLQQEYINNLEADINKLTAIIEEK